MKPNPIYCQPRSRSGLQYKHFHQLFSFPGWLLWHNFLEKRKKQLYLMQKYQKHNDNDFFKEFFMSGPCMTSLYYKKYSFTCCNNLPPSGSACVFNWHKFSAHSEVRTRKGGFSEVATFNITAATSTLVW